MFVALRRGEPTPTPPPAPQPKTPTESELENAVIIKMENLNLKVIMEFC